MGKTANQSSDLPMILAVLKKMFRAQGLTYRDVAKSLGISETSVKRYMSGGPISAQLLERLSQAAGFRFSDLVEMARREHEGQGALLTEEQEQALVEDQVLTLIFFLLRRGWTPQELKTQFGISEARLIGFLIRLERLRLIDLLPENKVRLLTPVHIKWRNEERMHRSTYEFLKEEFVQSRFEDPRVLWRHDLLQLSPGQIDQLSRMSEAFIRDARDLSETGSRPPRAETGWYGVWTVIQPIRLALRPENMEEPPVPQTA